MDLISTHRSRCDPEDFGEAGNVADLQRLWSLAPISWKEDASLGLGAYRPSDATESDGPFEWFAWIHDVEEDYRFWPWT